MHTSTSTVVSDVKRKKNIKKKTLPEGSGELRGLQCPHTCAHDSQGACGLVLPILRVKKQLHPYTVTGFAELFRLFSEQWRQAEDGMTGARNKSRTIALPSSYAKNNTVYATATP